MSKKRSEVGPASGVGPDGAAGEEFEEEAPIGTLFFMMIFLLLMVALWGSVYWLLLER